MISRQFSFDFSRNSAVDFNFPSRRGTGLARYLTHCTAETIDLIDHLCVYDPDHRWSAAQALRHPYFESIRFVFMFEFLLLFSRFRKEEYQTAHASRNFPWATDLRKARTIETRPIRSDSSSSQSSQEEPSASARSKNHKTGEVHYHVVKPDFPSVGFHVCLRFVELLILKIDS